jgi:hypothetical protein
MSSDDPVAFTKNGVALPTCIEPAGQKPVKEIMLP